jgi:release factor glutamine methyltransferase
VGIDISQKAVDVASENSRTNETTEKLKLVVGDIREYNFENRFELIVSNPPYVSNKEYNTLQKEITDYEPLIAVTDQNDGLEFYRIIAGKFDSLLKPGGTVYFEVGQDQAESVAEILSQNGITKIRFVKDLQKIDRIVVGEKK